MFKNKEKLLKEANDRLLVKLVFQNPCLYIKYVQQTSPAGFVEQTWVQIALTLRKLGSSILDPQKRWKQLKISFNGHLRNGNTRWYLYSDMFFKAQHTNAKKPSTVHTPFLIPGPGTSKTSNSNWHQTKDFHDNLESSSSYDVEMPDEENCIQDFIENDAMKHDFSFKYEMITFDDEIITVDDDSSLCGSQSSSQSSSDSTI
ncbi:uncharacterized protein LOC127287549 [Leptopilina boulardi]|uniref:uncharacterized protein LOC127287549 n=1 Tax=Leptopilina boulardi TaxID=63433 RepID=UPI0021F58724|nr:uncharacterized protein LOC127287549 [Leptopilina boulardi]